MKLVLYMVYLGLVIAAVVVALIYLLPLVGTNEIDLGAYRSPPVVAILDTGIDGDHVDLHGKVVAEVNLGASNTIEDIHGHGTHMAGIVASVCEECELISVKVTDDNGCVDADTLAEGITWAANNADVLLISLCLEETSDKLESAIRNCDAIIVAAAGIKGSIWYPAFYEECIAVTATMPDGSLMPLANGGSWVDEYAPGYEIYSTLPDDSYGYKSGTSQAAAHIAGVVAGGE